MPLAWAPIKDSWTKDQKRTKRKKEVIETSFKRKEKKRDIEKGKKHKVKRKQNKIIQIIK